MNLGLTKDEFELVIINSNNPALMKRYVHKLDNCDLSKSAIELIREEDLTCVNRITCEILSKYPTTSDKQEKMKLFPGIIILIGLFIGLIVFQKETKNDITSSQKLTHQKTNNNVPTKQNIFNKSEEHMDSFKNKKYVFSEELDSSNRKPELSNSLSTGTDEKNINNLPTNRQNLKAKTLESNNLKKSNSKLTKSIYKRKIRSIKSLKQVPDKYKNEEYSAEDLVDFYGGNKNLEKELLSKLKGKINDTDIPKKNTSIVFKFNVAPNGKISEINIQSRVNLELEEIIKETAVNLNKWIKGSKGIPVIYTIYVTFK